jgi:aminoglycoside 2''-phosphotransferase
VSDKPLEKYRAAIEEKFPQLEVKKIEYISEGWDSVGCRVNEKLLFRFPKRSEVAHNLLKEIKLLPRLAPALPLAIPQFSYVSTEPGKNFPFAFVGYELIEGEQMENFLPEIEQEEWWRPALGRFLTALHAFPVEQALECGVSEVMIYGEGSKVESWRDSLEDFFLRTREHVFPLISEERQDEIANYLEDFLEEERYFAFEPKLVHADLNGEHVLLDLQNKKVNGIIDFGDCGIGDPALDVWDSVLPYYGGKVDETWAERRHFYVRLPALHSVIFGSEHSDPALVEYGLNQLSELEF